MKQHSIRSSIKKRIKTGISGYGANANKIKGVGRIWAGLPVNAKVEILNLNAPMAASVSYLELLKKGMHEVSGIPESSLGGKQGISNTPGVAMHMQYLPLLEKTWMKRITYGEGIERITEIALRWMEKKKLLTPSDLDKMKRRYKVEIAWNDPLPKDQLSQINIIAKKLELKLMSRKAAMRELAVEDVPKIESEIEDDEAKELEFVYQGGKITTAGGKGKGAGPSGFEPGTGAHNT
ncbi:unnamed protein product [marine sediment metagenome]|uniref:Uncharacterized protein n=1 Tax=marine sediment metagenome TaxID=412755 RepID=X1QQH8_9ZZZZ